MPWSQTDISELLIAHRARGAICEDLQKENANLKDKLANRDLNIRHLTKLLKLAGTVRINIEKTIENSAKPCPECNYEEWAAQEDTTCLESNSCAHCDVEMEYLYEHEKREVCGWCENILEQDPSAFLEQLALEEENPVFENTGLCHNPLCENEELPSEMIGQQCNCGGYIWHKDEYTEGDFCLESNSCAHCHVEMEYLHGIIEKRETCRRCDNILEQDPSAFQ